MKNTFLTLIIICFCSSYILSQEKWGSYETTIAGPNFTLLEACGDSVEISTEYWFERIRITEGNFVNENAGRRIEGDSVFFKFSLLDNSLPFLLYDYSVELGDTVSGLWGEFIVTEVDTEFAIGEERKRITMESTYDGHLDIWLDGLGSKVTGYHKAGSPLFAPDAGSEFSCYLDEANGEYYYGDKDPTLCLIDETTSACMTTSVNDKKFDEHIKIFPNPTSEFINIEMGKGINTRTQAQLLTVEGKQLINKYCDGGNISLDTSSLKPGIYFLVINQNGCTTNHKIVIQ